jgi:hypothetical protein
MAHTAVSVTILWCNLIYTSYVPFLAVGLTLANIYW